MSENCRQHYKLATGEPLTKPPKGPNPGFARGGFLRMGKRKTPSTSHAVPKHSGRGR